MQTKAIKQKMKSVGNIAKITKTMEMVSVSKMKKAVDKAMRSKQYATHAQEIISVLGSAPELATHPMVVGNTATTELLVIIASDKGLCGGYHVQIAKAIRDFKKQFDVEKKLECITVGKYAEKMANKLQIPIIASFIGLPESLDVQLLDPIKKLVIQKFKDGEVSKVMVATTVYHKAMNYAPEIINLLPFTLPHTTNTKNDAVASEYVFEPSAYLIFENILSGLLAAELYQTLFEAKASEHSSRMVAMKNASDNAQALKDELTIGYNRARQAGITQEITEIISGSSALVN